MIFVSKNITSYSFFESMDISNFQKVLSLSKIPSPHVIVGKLVKETKFLWQLKYKNLNNLFSSTLS